MMTAPKIIFLAAMVAAALGVVAEVRVVATQQKEIAALKEQTDRLARQTSHTRAELATALQSSQQLKERLASPSRSESTPSAPVDPAADSSVEAWLTRVRQLKQLLAANPEQSVPELKLFDENDWLDFSRQAPLYRWRELTQDAIDETFARLRERASGKFSNFAYRALKEFAAQHGGLLPGSAGELAPYLDRSLDPAILRRYEVRLSGRLADAPPTAIAIAQQTVFDEMRESRLEITAAGGIKWSPAARYLNQDIDLATKAFAAANQGRLPAGPVELMPFIEKVAEDVDLPTLQKFWDSPLRKKNP